VAAARSEDVLLALAVAAARSEDVLLALAVAAARSEDVLLALAVAAARSEDSLLAAAPKQRILARDREDVFVWVDEGLWALRWTVEWTENLNWAEIFWPV
jgi:hypothetical protein